MIRGNNYRLVLKDVLASHINYFLRSNVKGLMSVYLFIFFRSMSLKKGQTTPKPIELPRLMSQTDRSLGECLIFSHGLFSNITPIESFWVSVERRKRSACLSKRMDS